MSLLCPIAACLLAACMPLAALATDEVQGKAPPTPEEEVSFRDSILQYYGFTEEASEVIRNDAHLAIRDWNSNTGGGRWDPQSRTIRLDSIRQEAAVRAFSMVWWESYRLKHPESSRRFSEAVVRMAKGAGSPEAVALAKTYVRGNGGRGFKGFFCGTGAWTPASVSTASFSAAAPSSSPCADPNRLENRDFDLTRGGRRARVLDREMFGGLAAWTMGRFKTGSRALPEHLWPFFEPLFSGQIYRTPYYDGGMP